MCRSRREHLDGDRPVEVRVKSLEHDPHPAGPDHLLDLVAAKLAQHLRMGRWREEIELDACGSCACRFAGLFRDRRLQQVNLLGPQDALYLGPLAVVCGRASQPVLAVRTLFDVPLGLAELRTRLVPEKQHVQFDPVANRLSLSGFHCSLTCRLSRAITRLRAM